MTRKTFNRLLLKICMIKLTLPWKKSNSSSYKCILPFIAFSCFFKFFYKEITKMSEYNFVMVKSRFLSGSRQHNSHCSGSRIKDINTYIVSFSLRFFQLILQFFDFVSVDLRKGKINKLLSLNVLYKHFAGINWMNLLNEFAQNSQKRQSFFPLKYIRHKSIKQINTLASNT